MVLEISSGQPVLPCVLRICPWHIPLLALLLQLAAFGFFKNSSPVAPGALWAPALSGTYGNKPCASHGPFSWMILPRNAYAAEESQVFGKKPTLKRRPTWAVGDTPPPPPRSGPGASVHTRGTESFGFPRPWFGAIRSRYISFLVSIITCVFPATA